MSLKNLGGFFSKLLICVLIIRICCGCASASKANSGGTGGSTGGNGGGSSATISLSPTAASVQAPGGTQQFTAAVTPTSQTVSWALTGSGCSASTCGTLSANSGGTVVYTAPASLPSPASVTLTATAGSVTATAAITLTAGGGNVSVSVSPTTASLQAPGGTQQFTATVAPASQSVSWALAGSGCSGTTCGTLSSTSGGTVVYTAPVTLPNPASVTLTATAGSVTATAAITLTSPGGGNVTISVAPTTATVQTPSGTQQFTATVTPASQTVNWSLTGSGCTGGTCGTLSSASGGTVVYTAPASPPSPATVTLTATAGSVNATAAITLTSGGGSAITVSVSPKRGGLAVSQSLPVTATVQNDPSNKGVTWTASSGTFTNVTSTSATYVAPTSAGVYSITATSVADTTKSASSAIGVTALPGVLTHHNDLSRDGANTQEFALTTSNVNTATFGKLFSCQTDGAIYAQPLWVPQLSVGGAPHNVIVVATQHDGLFAFDADASPCVTLWHISLIDSAHGGTAGESPVPSYGAGALVGGGAGDISPEVGVTGTPVIDPTTKTLYVVSKSANLSTSQLFQRIHAIDLTTGNERANSPHSIDSSITVNGSAPDGSGGKVSFNPGSQNQRPGLALYNGVVYVSWASHEDRDPYHGWIVGFNTATLAIVSVFNTTPNQVNGASYARGGIWMSGGAPAVDSSGFLYCITGNGTFDANNGGTNYGDTILKFNTSGTFGVADYFTPLNQAILDSGDLDFGAGAATIIVDQPGAKFPHLIVGGGKDGNLFVLNRDSLGGYSSSANNVVQTVNVGNSIFATPVFWNNNLYLSSSGPVQQFALANGQFTKSNQSATGYGFPGPTPSLSANNTSNPILWALDNTKYCTPQSHGCGPAVLHAYDATNVSNEFWNSTQGSGNQAGFAVKFTVPTVANGKVYVGTRGNNTGGAESSTSVPGELDVYGLLPN